VKFIFGFFAGLLIGLLTLVGTMGGFIAGFVFSGMMDDRSLLRRYPAYRGVNYQGTASRKTPEEAPTP
jgi:hypothetical protein